MSYLAPSNLKTILTVLTRLADYDVVVTTYSLVSKEIQVQKEDAENPSKDPDPEVFECSIN